MHDLIGRLGGDEFLLIFPHTPCADAFTVSSRIEQSVREIELSGASLPVTVSIGLTQAVSGETAAPLLARADKALYNAKNAGRNCCRILLHETEDETNQRLPIPSTQVPHPSIEPVCRLLSLSAQPLP